MMNLHTVHNDDYDGGGGNKNKSHLISLQSLVDDGGCVIQSFAKVLRRVFAKTE